MTDDNDKAIIDAEAFAMQHKEVIWAELGLTSAHWWKNRPPETAKDMIELTGCLTSTVHGYYQDNAPELWEKLEHDQRLTQQYMIVSEWLAEQVYHYRNN